jgi:hypothetical protein
MSDAHYYSVRRLSPYQGTAQVVESQNFRAITSDGATWRVQFFNQRSRLARYAIWRADGAGDPIEIGCADEFKAAMQNHPPIPFPPADNVELWLLDAKEQLPLAILASTLERITPPRAISTLWRATLEDDASFIASSLLPEESSGSPVSAITHGEILNRCVQKAAGPMERAQWFRRACDGSGIGLHGSRLDPDQLGRRLDRQAFPELLLREKWEDEREQALVQDYHDWQAPGLLTHRQLTPATRDRLERAACRQSVKLYQLRHFLPEMLNADLLSVAFVEAVIRRSA